MAKYELFADEESVWMAHRPPTQDQINRTAIHATSEGWNGTSLELRRDGQWVRDVEPSERALAIEAGPYGTMLREYERE